ncbi:MAG: DNA-3-methyladenine glycosylase 2 family protein, partial [Pseudomonadota bacterium]
MDVTDQSQLTRAMAELAERDNALGAAYAAVGCRPWRTREGGYAGLARIIAFQQLSTKAAATIWGRVEAQLDVVAPDGVLAASEDELRACGLSRPKIRHLRSIAEA